MLRLKSIESAEDCPRRARGIPWNEGRRRGSISPGIRAGSGDGESRLREM